MTARIGDWMRTFTGIAFWPLDPRPEEIDIRDIAHALAHQCRYGGHARTHYSVAEHSWILSHAVPPDMALVALMHDAAEAYLVDVPRPIKKYLGNYSEIEHELEFVISVRFGLEYPWPDELMDLDTRILNDEREQVMATPPMAWGTPGEPLGVTLQCWPAQTAELKFLERFMELTG